MKLEPNDIGVIFWTVLMLVIGIVCGAVVQNKIDTGDIQITQPKYLTEADSFCVAQDFDRADFVQFVVKKYYIVVCTRITDYEYQVRRFALYEDELLKHTR
jgi:hypothetical protein